MDSLPRQKDVVGEPSTIHPVTPVASGFSVDLGGTGTKRNSIAESERVGEESSRLASASSSTVPGLSLGTGRSRVPDSVGPSRSNSHSDTHVLAESLRPAPATSVDTSNEPASVELSPVSRSDIEDLVGSLEETSQRIPRPNRYENDSQVGGVGLETRNPPVLREYRYRVARLAIHLPHLKQVLSIECRSQNNGILHCYDIIDGTRHPTILGSVDFSGPRANPASIKRLIDNESDLNGRTRFFVAEDISPTLIEALGSAFKPNPEFFEEHLYQAGYSDLSAQVPHPRRWATSTMPKEYVSLRWYRPVLRAIKGAFSAHLRTAPGSNKYNNLMSVEWEDRPNMVGSDGAELNQQGVQHKLEVKTNIFRQGWPLTTNPDEVLGDSEVPVAWEEKVTLLRHWSPNGHAPIFLFLLDPLPKIKHTKTTISQPSRSIFLTGTLNSAPDSHTEVKMLDPYRPIALRGSWNTPLDIEITDEMLQQLGDNLAHARSTRQDMMSWLPSQTPPQNGRPDAVLALLRVVHQDLAALLRIMNSTLEEISIDSANDYRMQDRLYHWRQLMSQFELELPDIAESLENFVRFVYGDKVPEPAQELLDDCTNRIRGFLGQVRRAYGALRADMSVLESRRGISEAENVTKLTELAFVFIPLTFSASIFSMQIQELQNPVPLSSFVVAAVVVAALSYSVRLIIRSSLVITTKRRVFDKARAYSNLPPGSRIPTRAFLSWAIHASRPFILRSVFFLALCVTLVPIVFLWTHSTLDASFKAMITIIFLTSGLIFSWYFSVQMIESQGDEHEWFLMLLYKLRQRRRRKNRRRNFSVASA
ncbi:hypothetical protein AOQ84DRAFT_442330 [Glonium stellatum]|uniref:Uncharacterized protein n=1 Tax=Glonium stellatum TaxID=574774 RepID=A0A8E2ESD0_9PEZI|nr:hypothetical protein AOQ84DRAFT_442330 [Glonium stellatum]